MAPILSRAEKKSRSLGVGSIEKQWASLALFVGIPLPGTGAWTGAMGAFLLGMPTAIALSSIFTGVCMAGVIVSAITLAGKKGGIAALAALLLLTGREFFSDAQTRLFRSRSILGSVGSASQCVQEQDSLYWKGRVDQTHCWPKGDWRNMSYCD